MFIRKIDNFDFFMFFSSVYRVVYRSGDKIEVATESDIRGGAKVPGKMGRKKIQISRIGDERNRQVRDSPLYVMTSLIMYLYWMQCPPIIKAGCCVRGFCGCFQYLSM